jgi:thiol-disulfide isomerase/thioredoxin
MRNMIWIVLAIIALQACEQKSESYTITVDLDGSEGRWVKLLTRAEGSYVTYDSAFAEAGSPAVLTKGIDEVSTMFLIVEDTDASIQLLVENSDYQVSGNMEDPVIKTNSKAQNDLNRYNEELKPLTEKMTEMMSRLREGPDEDNPEAYEALREEYFKLYDQQDKMDSAYVADHPESYASVLVLRGIFYQYDANQLEAALNRFDSPLQEMEEFKYMHDKMEHMKAVDIGQEYTDFGLETPEGELLKVSDLHNGNVLMIDFWASWCGPCRRANPEVVEIYHDYNGSGFEILGVSLDRDSSSWVQAIAEDQLAWKHISDLQYWNSAAAELYGVSAIPHTVLIDRNGIIIAKNLHGDELREAIESLL